MLPSGPVKKECCSHQTGQLLPHPQRLVFLSVTQDLEPWGLDRQYLKDQVELLSPTIEEEMEPCVLACSPYIMQFSSVQLLSRVRLFATP